MTMSSAHDALNTELLHAAFDHSGDLGSLSMWLEHDALCIGISNTVWIGSLLAFKELERMERFTTRDDLAAILNTDKKTIDKSIKYLLKVGALVRTSSDINNLVTAFRPARPCSLIHPEVFPMQCYLPEHHEGDHQVTAIDAANMGTANQALLAKLHL